MIRYFTDIRCGCGAVRDRKHPQHNESYPGLHNDTADVVEYIHGFKSGSSWEMKPSDVEYLEKLCDKLNIDETQLIRDIKISIVEGKYKCISAYNIPDKPNMWLDCPNCGLAPLIWEYDNGRSTACGCGENVYKHFAIHSESIMSHVGRHDGSALSYDSHKLRKNWNHWVMTGEEIEKYEDLRALERW
jgi:hypothetical protein